ncbi:MAG: diguanylate cyclase [Lachnospira sp.]
MVIEDKEIKELKTKAFISDLLAGVDTEDNIDSIFGYILQGLGELTHSTETNIYEFDDGREHIENIYHWSNKAGQGKETFDRNISRDNAKWISSLENNKLVIVKSPEETPDDIPCDYSVIESMGIRELMIIPVSVKHQLTACISLMNPDFNRFEAIDDTFLFLGRQVGSLYSRDKFNHKYMLFMDGIRSSNLSEFIVDYTTGRYEAFRVTKVLSKLIPEEGDWEWLRHFYADIIKPEYREEVLNCTEREYMDRYLCTEKSTYAIDIERDLGSSTSWFRLEFSVVSFDEEGHLERFVLLVKDITEQKKREEWMQYKIEHDELTGAMNRTAFNRVTKMLEQSENPFGLVIMDIDRFKIINDTYGHDVGDSVLKHLTVVLNDKFRTSDKVFRIGGDEFAVIMDRITLAKAGSVKNIMDKVNNTTMKSTDGLPEFSVSAGVTFSSLGYNEIVFRNADIALYRTKETTRRGCTVFEEIQDKQEEVKIC